MTGKAMTCCLAVHFKESSFRGLLFRAGLGNSQAAAGERHGPQ